MIALAPIISLFLFVADVALGAAVGLNNNKFNVIGTITNTDSIFSTIRIVKQKSGPDPSTPPDQPVPKTVVTAIDGRLTNAGMKSSLEFYFESRNIISTRSDAQHRSYDEVFGGTGTGPNDRDASVEGTAYLTYTVVDNSTYNVAACLNFCDSVPGCVFANLYYEYNNYGLDYTFGGIKSDLKCAVYGDVHSASEKTDFGGQQSYPAPGPTIYIQQSSGYEVTPTIEPGVPNGYQLVFGPTSGANIAQGYMGFVLLDHYDVNECARQCAIRTADPNGGACQYFNIWRALDSGNPTTYTCSMYDTVPDPSTATNTGQGSIEVSESRGYRRI